MQNPWGRAVRRLMWIAGLFAAIVAGPAMAACSTPGASDSMGSFSPAALKGSVGPPSVSAAPLTSGFAGFTCTSSAVLTLSLVNFLKGTITAGTVFRLTSATTSDVIPFTIAAKSDGTSLLAAGTPFSFVSGLSLDLLGLGGSGAMNVPLYFKFTTPNGSAAVAPGTYTITFPIKWEWYFCPGVYVTGCSQADDGGTSTANVTLTMMVVAKPPTTAVTSLVTYDPISNTSNPKALPGSKRRTTITITNPDIVSLASGTIDVTLPTAALTTIAFDGDGTGGALVQSSQGSPVSGLTLTYSGISSGTDNVYFSTDNGATWTADPAVVPQASINKVQFKPQGTMAPGSSFRISIPYLVKLTP